MKTGDTILTQTYVVGRVTKVEDPRVYYVPLATPEAKPEMAWMARVAVIPPDVVNTLFGAGETPIDDTPIDVPRYQPVPALAALRPAPKPWYTRVLDWLEKVSIA